MNGVAKSFDRVVCNGSHCGLEEHGRGLTKAEEDLASWGTVHGSVYYCNVGPNGGEKDRLLTERASSVSLVRLVRRSFSLVIKSSFVANAVPLTPAFFSMSTTKHCRMGPYHDINTL